MKTERPPNFVIMFLDDSGWADFRPFARTDYPTPHVERLAQSGCLFTQFYVPQAICSASRASLLTGCYPERHRVFGAIAPRERGLDPAFATVAEVLKTAGYATGCFGKWHIGDHTDTRPPARGFDESSGLMYSNDMWRYHPESRFYDSFELQYWKNDAIAIRDLSPQQQNYLTTWYTEDAVDFIRRHARKGPFFLYVPHNMPHVPLACSEKFLGKSGQGLYADVMMEIDWSLGCILDALEETQVREQTIVLFTSDNGPWLSYGNHAGRTPYREGKATAFDGGVRSALVMSAPGHLRPGSTSGRPFCSVDILPTFARLAGAPLPRNPMDGKDVWSWICGASDAVNPHAYYSITTGDEFQAVVTSDGRWKLHLPHAYRTLDFAGQDGRPGRYRMERIALSLFDMQEDPFETTDVSAEQPEVFERLKAWVERRRDEWFPPIRK